MIHEITLRNILSFGPDTPPLKLGNLNVLIGPNGSGKSNLIEAIGLLQAVPTGVSKAVENGGTLGDWVWKGGKAKAASISAVISAKDRIPALRHSITIGEDEFYLHLTEETIKLADPDAAPDKSLLYHANHWMGELRVDGEMKMINLGSGDAGSSVVERRRDPEAYPEISSLDDRYRDIRIYRDWVFGRKNAIRGPQPVKLRGDRLEEDFSNLIPFLNRKFGTKPAAKRKLVKVLSALYEGFSDYELVSESDSLQLYFSEGDMSIRSKRLSDGSLRFLSMAAVLLDPEPPALICIEEPELGLHPDVVTKVADLLKEASKKTQIIVTTHSDMLVDALNDQADRVVVCEKHDGQTRFERLDAERLSSWIKEYGLAELWSRGTLGGTRW
ncbi:MAG TPA: AAA family ATPase [Flavobacteriales bacterium]|nr:AAA family ATPase [Flavobacteriales bacterium]